MYIRCDLQEMLTILRDLWTGTFLHPVAKLNIDNVTHAKQGPTIYCYLANKQTEKNKKIYI